MILRNHDEPEVPTSIEGQRWNQLPLGDLDTPAFYSTLEEAEAHQRARTHRTMQAWKQMLAAYNSQDVRERALLRLEELANSST